MIINEQKLIKLKELDKIKVNDLELEILEKRPDANLDAKKEIIEEWYEITLVNNKQEYRLIIYISDQDQKPIFQKIKRSSISNPWEFDIIEEIKVHNLQML